MEEPEAERAARHLTSYERDTAAQRARTLQLGALSHKIAEMSNV